MSGSSRIHPARGLLFALELAELATSPLRLLVGGTGGLVRLGPHFLHLAEELAGLGDGATRDLVAALRVVGSTRELEHLGAEPGQVSGRRSLRLLRGSGLVRRG